MQFRYFGFEGDEVHCDVRPKIFAGSAFVLWRRRAMREERDVETIWTILNPRDGDFQRLAVARVELGLGSFYSFQNVRSESSEPFAIWPSQ